MKEKTRTYIENAILAFIASIIILVVLFCGEPIGLSDNGDFARIINANGISYTTPNDEHSFVFNNRYYMNFNGDSTLGKIKNTFFNIKDMRDYPSIQHVFVKIAMFVNLSINFITGSDLHIFRIEVLGAVYILLYALSLFVLFNSIKISKKWIEILIKAIIIIVACDIGYVCYFNSFYGEGLQTIFLIFSVAFGLRFILERQIKKINIIFFFISLILYAWSKFANIPLAIVTILFCLPFLYFKKDKQFRIFISVTSAISLSLLLVIYLVIPKWMDNQTTYNSVFFGVLKDSGVHSEQYLKDLGLPSSMLELTDSNYYMKRVSDTINNETFKKDFSKISKADIGIFYLKHPGYFIDKLEVSAKNSGIIRPSYLSNYQLSHPRLTFSKRFELWGDIRKNLPFDKIWWNAFICIMFVGFMLLRGIKNFKTGNREKFLIYIGIGAAVFLNVIFDFCIPIVTNGEGDIAKHMFAFIQIIDIMTFALLFVVLSNIYKLYDFARIKIVRYKVHVIASLAVLSILILAFCLILNATSDSKNRKSVVRGSYIEFGSYRGQKLIWQITALNNQDITLLCTKTIGNGAFSNSQGANSEVLKYGDNQWAGSKIRVLLNGEFLNAFTDKEKSLINDSKNRILLSTGHTGMKAGGVNEFFWSHIPSLSDRGYDKAYYTECTDKVFVPDIKLICNAYRDGLKITRDRIYWLNTPYYNNDSMVRTADIDGYIYMRDANVENVGILPALNLKAGFSVNGEGSRSKPLTITYN